jgi:hypothetical protein
VKAENLKAGQDSRENWKTINQINAQVRLLEQKVKDHQGDIAELRRRGRAGDEDNWRFAAAGIDYDKDNDYVRNEIVEVQPANTVVVDGHIDPDTAELVYTQAGMYVCLRPPRVAIPETDPVEYEVHTPQWPLPVPGTTDHADNYWLWLRAYPLCTLPGG